jgi:superfamily II DNA or RNA helicase
MDITLNIPSQRVIQSKNAYIGCKGYTIFKNTLSDKELKKIKSDLTIKPYKGIIQYSQKCDNTYPIYRESDKKIYIPRYYGIENFGIPHLNNLSIGEKIKLEFNGTLRENQQMVVNKYLDFVNIDNKNTGGGLLELPCAYGKTTLSLYIISKLCTKTLVIVHKEFLLNQWVERINQFLPGARIGKIQGKIIDIENKDIVMCMLQSVSMKTYDSNIFSSFGLTVIDEVHHISSEVFSNALFKVVTNYTLGLSATMNRQDGTTRVFKMFIGDIIYKGKRDIEHNVTVQAINYYIDDEQFNTIEYDHRGNPKYSTMISKICKCDIRSEYIIGIIRNLLNTNNGQQIMLLAHNKNVLKYIYDAIDSRNIASVGYYVGGMKDVELKKTETKQIVIATYAMASEALDIKTLSILIMVTPKTTIEQSVGRILRSKHNNPIIVDIIDSHSIFKNQWNKRKKFYNSQKYKIIYSSNVNKPINGKINWTDTDEVDDDSDMNYKYNKNDIVSIFKNSFKKCENDDYEEI